MVKWSTPSFFLVVAAGLCAPLHGLWLALFLTHTPNPVMACMFGTQGLIFTVLALGQGWAAGHRKPLPCKRVYAMPSTDSEPQTPTSTRVDIVCETQSLTDCGGPPQPKGDPPLPPSGIADPHAALSVPGAARASGSRPPSAASRRGPPTVQAAPPPLPKADALKPWTTLIPLALVVSDLLWACCGAHSLWFLVAILPMSAARRLHAGAFAGAVVLCAGVFTVRAAFQRAILPFAAGLLQSPAPLLLVYGCNVVLPAVLLAIQLTVQPKGGLLRAHESPRPRSALAHRSVGAAGPVAH